MAAVAPVMVRVPVAVPEYTPPLLRSENPEPVFTIDKLLGVPPRFDLF